MAQPRCRRRPLSLGRRMLCDYLRHSRGEHTAGAERVMRLADVAAARTRAMPRPSWGAIMTKAFALSARNHPEMRRIYFPFPWGHIGEFEHQVASVIMHRRVGDEDVILLAPLLRPEEQGLAQLDRHLREYREEPVEKFRPFREALFVGRLPTPLRRFLWWMALEVLPARRARHFGTFGVTTMSPFGAKTLTVPSLWAAFLHYGPVSESGEVAVGLAFDHRLMDGAVVGYTLLEMEQVLHHAILTELRGMTAARAA